MPFDALPEGLLTDMARLRLALDGVRTNWGTHHVGLQDAEDHCAIGWLLVATDWDRAEAVRLALDYVYPALPDKARNPDSRLRSIWEYNDRSSHKRMVGLFDDAVRLAEQRAVR
jgi:hypothetical protein